MAVLGEIRKRPILLMGIIAIALLAFLVNPDSLDKLFGKDPNVLGSVNGEEITRNEYESQLSMLRQQYSQQGMPATGLENIVWDNIVQSKLIKQKFDEMGFEMNENYFWSQLQFDPQFAQDSTLFDSKGNFNLQKIKTQVETIKNTNPQQYNSWLQNREMIEYRMMGNQVFSNITNGITMSTKVAENMMVQRDALIDVDYVKVDYGSYAQKNPIKVTTKDLENYIKRFPTRYKSEANVNLGISYFPAKASQKDENAVREIITDLQNAEGVENFTTTQNDSMFVVLNSDIGYNNSYLPENQLPLGIRESIKTASKGQVLGPYKEGEYYVLSKLIDKKMNDSIATYKVANVVKTIYPSDQTQNDTDRKARELIKKVQGKSFTDFENIAKKSDAIYSNPQTVKRFDGTIPGVGTEKDDAIIAWAFDEDREPGDTNLFKVDGSGDRIVVHFKSKKDKGLIDAESQRKQLEVVVRNELLAKKIIEDIQKSKATTLQSVASKFNTTSQSTQLNVLSPKLDDAIEPKVAGIAYSMEKGKTSNPIKGMGGVYVIRKKGQIVNKQPGVVEQLIQSATQREAQNFGRGYMESLKNTADIEDYRSEIFGKTQNK